MLPSTSFATLDRRASILVSLVFLAVASWFLYAGSQSDSTFTNEPEKNQVDLALYQAVVGRLGSGEPYYEALGSELRARNFPTVPVFNWRTPAHLLTMAALPKFMITAILLIALITCIMFQFRWMSEDGYGYSFIGSACLLSITALINVTVSSAQYFSEIWVGLFIWLSVASYANKWLYAGVIFGLLALFFRELAAIYVIIAIYIAYRSGNRSELIAWAAGLFFYGAYYAVHYYFVSNSLTEADFAEARNWLAIGGAKFLIETNRMNPLLGLLPDAIKALVIPMAVLGAFANASTSTVHARLALFAYLVFFFVAGLPFNYYWGAIYTTLIVWNLLWFCPAALDLIRNITHTNTNQSSSNC
jgi:hypothetical protein